MTKRTYRGTAYRQNNSEKTPWLISFVARAEELREWTGIPRRSEQGLVGFQRADDEGRVLKAKQFFDTHEENQSPTSIVVGIHPPAPGGERTAILEFEDGATDDIRPCTLTVTLPDQQPLADVIATIRAQISARLTASAETDAAVDAEAEEISEGEAELAEGEEDEEDAPNGSGAAAEDEEIELGRSLLRDLLLKLDDAAWCEAHEEDLRDLAKPATIIDGQHRLKGAEQCERGIPFSVCAIYDCRWPEQVFQFTVVNYTARGIPDQFITANAALSLTTDELQDLQTRLLQADVKVIEYELMRVVNFDVASPFYNLVNLTTKKQEDKIGYKTMVGVGKAWYLGKNPAVAQIIEHIYPDIKGKKPAARAQRLERWKREDWGLFFKDFWEVVRQTYELEKTESGASLWTVGQSNLMLAVVLSELQSAFLINLAAQDESFFETVTDDPISELRKKIRNRAEKFIKYFEPEFFAREWKIKSLNTGVGRTALNDVFRSMVDARGSFKYGSSALFTGKTS